jgi:hypothetical protein
MFDCYLDVETVEKLKKVNPYLTEEDIRLFKDLLTKIYKQVDFIRECSNNYFSIKPEYIKFVNNDSSMVDIMEIERDGSINDEYIPINMLVMNYDQIQKWVIDKREENRRADEEFRNKILKEKKEERLKQYLELKNEFESNKD